MFAYYLKLGFLSIRANPALSSLMVAAVAIGIGACMTIVTVRHVMSDNPIAHKNDVLYHVQVDNWNPADPYEDPENPEIVCHTAEETPEESAAIIVAYLEDHGYVPAA